MTCESVAKDLPLFLYGELSFEDEELLHQHLDVCEDCRAAVARERKMHSALDEAEAAVPAALLASCRRDLRLTLAEQAPRQGWWEQLRAAIAGHGRVWNPIALTAMLTAAFMAGKMTITQPSGGVQEAGLTPTASRVRYVEPTGKGQVQIVVEEMRERKLSGRIQDAHIRELLLSAARESSDAGVRVETMDLLRTQCASKEVRKALLAALQQDPNPGVRLKALEGLKPYAGDQETRQVLAHVLLADDNPGVRTQAIDLLIQRPEPDMAGVYQQLLQKEDNGYVRQRCERALRDMNASLETF